MMTRCLFLIIVLSLSGSCIRNNQVQEKIVSKTCCLGDLLYHSNYGSFSPDFIKITLVNCDSATPGSIESVVFPQIVIEDKSFFDLWDSKMVSPDTLALIVNTNYFEDGSLSKDSIEYILSARIGIVTSENDTIYVEPCR